MPKNIAIFASGTGSNAKKIVEYLNPKGEIAVSLIVSNNPRAKVLKMAADKKVENLVLDRSQFYESEDILKIFNKYSIDYVVLAGFLWLVPTYLVKAYKNRMVNIHPALLPKYGGKGMFGMNVHAAVKKAKEKESGITIHYVNDKYDDGSIVFQKSCKIEEQDTPEEIAGKVLKLEHRYFPKVVEKLVRIL